MLDALLRWIGFGLCHQIPQRSFAAGGLQAPVCARDTGIYAGFVIALALISLLHRGDRPTRFPRPHVWVVMGLLLAFMGWDGISSYSGLRQTTNEIRLLTGLGVGFSAAAIIAPILNDEIWRRGSANAVLDPFWRFGVWVLAIPASFLVIDVAGPRLWVLFPILIAVAIIVTLTAINLVVVAMLPAFDRRAENIVDLLPGVAIALAVAILEIAIAGALKGFMLQVVARIT
jgi:uncharacterized membrane protein